MTSALANELRIATELAREAGRAILDVYSTDFAVTDKGGNEGPVTEADKRANTLIVQGLRRAFPTDGVVAEESKDKSDAGKFARCWYVDPLDGTKEFVARNGEFAVQIGLAVAGVARLGVLYLPVPDRLYAGIVGEGCVVESSEGTRSLVMPPPGDSLRMIVSRSNKSRRNDRVRELLGITQVVECGSVGVKCSRLAEGLADLYVHGSRYSSRWDACAPEAVLRAAGGSLTDIDGVPYRYDGDEIENVRGLLGCRPELIERVVVAVRQMRAEMP